MRVRILFVVSERRPQREPLTKRMCKWTHALTGNKCAAIQTLRSHCARLSFTTKKIRTRIHLNIHFYNWNAFVRLNVRTSTHTNEYRTASKWELKQYPVCERWNQRLSPSCVQNGRRTRSCSAPAGFFRCFHSETRKKCLPPPLCFIFLMYLTFLRTNSMQKIRVQKLLFPWLRPCTNVSQIV